MSAWAVGFANVGFGNISKFHNPLVPVLIAAQATLDAFMHASAQQQAYLTERLASLERQLAHLKGSGGGGGGDGGGDGGGGQAQPPQQHTIQSEAPHSPAAGDAAAASGLAVAAAPAANGSALERAASGWSGGEDPLSPGSRAHVESMYNDALSAADGGHLLSCPSLAADASVALPSLPLQLTRHPCG